MISLRQVYTEAVAKDYSDFYEKLRDVLNDGRFSQATKALLSSNKGLYRFVVGNRGQFYYTALRMTDRKPKDTTKGVDDKFEEIRKQSYPKIPSRQKAVFCYPFDPMSVSNMKKGSIYGNTSYVVILMNGFKLFQSFIFPDFTVSHVALSIKSFLDGYGDPDDLEFSMLEQIGDYFKRGTTDINKIKTDTRLSSEVIVEHNGYWAINAMFIREFVKKEKGMNGIQWFKAVKSGEIS